MASNERSAVLQARVKPYIHIYMYILHTLRGIPHLTQPLNAPSIFPALQLKTIYAEHVSCESRRHVTIQQKMGVQSNFASLNFYKFNFV